LIEKQLSTGPTTAETISELPLDGDTIDARKSNDARDHMKTKLNALIHQLHSIETRLTNFIDSNL
jgi:hypothetical protein